MRSQLPENDKGRPEIVPVGAGMASSLFPVLLAQISNGTVQVRSLQQPKLYLSVSFRC